MSDHDAHITIAANGPYLVSGDVPLRRRSAVVSEHGERLAWRTDATLETKDRYVLCRCGQSSNKPFCDATHASAGFDGTETAASTGIAERSDRYDGTGVTVVDDRSVCEHAGFCGIGATNVWKMVAGTDDTGRRSLMMAMIERCPSGALRYEIDGVQIEPALPVEIAVIADGPIWVTGGIAIDRADGAAFEARNRVTLCRCGQSANKPLCDGSHAKVGFSDDGSGGEA